MTEKITLAELVQMFGPGLQVGDTIIPAIPMEGLLLLNNFEGPIYELRTKLRALASPYREERAALRDALARMIGKSWFLPTDWCPSWGRERHVLDNYPGQHVKYREAAFARADVWIALMERHDFRPETIGEQA